ncbi:hypothetical protein [Amycolatopsis sp. CA-230715]|uniref:hypothetical protein n=1 Tax=Amycolatopsis sp. CA-230715 TaxID=2745196 RepID=UPI001C02FDF0|nr:hypothetical protein [Amycolatopsis sp. CA-230715]
MTGIVVTVALLVPGRSIPGAAFAPSATAEPVVITSSSSDTPTPTPSTPSIPYNPAPKASDFSFKAKVTEKKCFGSAGCSVRYTLADFDYLGVLPLDPAKPCTVIYEVTGGEDGTETGSFTVTGLSVSFTEKSTVSTKTSKATISVRPVDVLCR